MNKLDTTNFITHKEYKQNLKQKVFLSNEDREKRNNLISEYKKQIVQIKQYFKQLDDEEKIKVLELKQNTKEFEQNAKNFSNNFFKSNDELNFIIENKEEFSKININAGNFITKEKISVANKVVKELKKEKLSYKDELQSKKRQYQKADVNNRQNELIQYKKIDTIVDNIDGNINTLNDLKALRKQQLKDIKNYHLVVRNQVIDSIYKLKFSYYEEKETIIRDFPEAGKKRQHRFERNSERFEKDGREILLEVKKASVHFKVGLRTVKACNNLSFKVYKGETFGLVGESGSGKTTISRAIIGINKLARGAIFFKGRNISAGLSKKQIKQNKKNIQMIFQDPAASLNERANVDYIVSEGLYNFKLFKTNKDRIKKVQKMIEEVGLLPEHLTRYPHEFSGGQRQRIGIARALIIEPELVLADEPISALDVSIRAQVLNLLQKLQRERKLTYLFIAHDLSIIKYISDRIGVMHRGYMVELGSADDIYKNPIHPYTRSLLTAIPQPDPISKNDRKKVAFKEYINYDNCDWIEIKPNHFVLGTKELIKKWLKNDK